VKKTWAIVEKNILIHFRFKFPTIIMYIRPFISLLMPIIIFQKFLEYNINFGPYNTENYFIFIFSSYNVLLLRRMVTSIPDQLLREKFWNILPNLIIAPFNKFYLLFGFMISEFIIIAIPFFIFFIITIIIYPITFLKIIINIFNIYRFSFSIFKFRVNFRNISNYE